MESQHERALPTDQVCAECGDPVTTSWRSHSFFCGTGSSAAELNVRVPVRRCDGCEFEYLDDVSERIKHDAVCRHLGALTPKEIRRIRERCRLSRPEFAKVTGIAEACLRGWENGLTVQDRAHDNYLRLLARRPVADGPLPHMPKQRQPIRMSDHLVSATET